MAFANLSLRAHNPLFHRQQGRIILPYTYDDSLDSNLPLECFFIMPDAVRSIRKARVWVDRKPYRAYETATASEASHTHTVTIGSHTHSLGESGAGSSNPSPDNCTAGGAGHGHIYFRASSVTDGGGSSNPTSSAGAGHTHNLTYAISETGPSGTVSLFVADDGTNYGSAITSGVNSIADQDITAQLTKSSGSKRLKITGTGLMRVQVTLVLDLSVAVFS